MTKITIEKLTEEYARACQVGNAEWQMEIGKDAEAAGLAAEFQAALLRAMAAEKMD